MDMKKIDIQKIEEWMDNLAPQTGDNWMPLQQWWIYMKQLISRVKELEASNAKLTEAIRLLRRGLREEADKVLEE